MSQAISITVQIVVAVVMGVGLISLLFPTLPGLTIIWVAALSYGLFSGFNWASGIIFFVMTLLMIAGNLADNILMGASARQTGASWLSIGAALVGGVLGSIFFPPLGGLVAALLALFAVEFARLRDWRKALESARSLATGCGWSVVVRFLIGAIMILLWILWSFVLLPMP